MDIKNICIVAFAAVVCANACADVTKLKTVTMVTNLVYDTELELGEKILIKEEVIVKDNIGRSSRAFFRPQASVSFSCSILGVLNISGSASRRIEIITPGQPQWKERHDVYNKNWGSERTDTTEWQAAYAHEMDHWNSFNAFFSFLHMLNEFDGTKLCHLCNEVKEDLERQYNVMRGSAMQHSAKYDTDGFKGGGMYPKAQ